MKICVKSAYSLLKEVYPMKKEINVAVMGCGTVGQGVCEILIAKGSLLAHRSDTGNVSLKKVLDIRDLSETPFSDYWVTDLDEIVNDPEINVVVEAMGGVRFAFPFCMRCLEAGKNVVTSNKQLVAEKGEELFEAARKNDVSFRFGAAVCGGIPAMRTMVYGLAANRIRRVTGILNGTTNLILTKMLEEKMSFEGALRLAQENGYAEADPTDDIEGHDACRKIAILASMAFGKHVYPHEVATTGITKITPEDASYATAFGCKIKLLGKAKLLEDGSVYAAVSPAFVKRDAILAGVSGVFNAVEYEGDEVGEVLLYGKGAGKNATASAVIADILDCGRKPGFDEAYCWAAGADKKMADVGEMRLRLYVRGYASDPNAALSALRENFGSLNLLRRENAPENEIAFISPVGKEKELLEQLTEVRGFVAASVIRVEE